VTQARYSATLLAFASSTCATSPRSAPSSLSWVGPRRSTIPAGLPPYSSSSAESYAREYFRVVTTDGSLVWLFRGAARDRWFLHGWWD